MTSTISRMAAPGPMYQRLEADILDSKEIVTQLKKDSRCKVIQAIALSALFVIAAVAAFILASLYAPSYAPIVLFAGAYFFIGQMGEFVRTQFKDKWVQLDKQAEKVQLIAQNHHTITNDTAYKEKLRVQFQPENNDELEKYTYLAAHYRYWKETSKEAVQKHKKHVHLASFLIQLYQKPTDSIRKRIVQHMVDAQHTRELALQSRVEAAFIRALMHRPNFLLTPSFLYRTAYAPIPLSTNEGNLSINVSLLESEWAHNLLIKSVPPYQDGFFESNRADRRCFLRSEIGEFDPGTERQQNRTHFGDALDLAIRPRKQASDRLSYLDLDTPRTPPQPDTFPLIVKEIIATMDEQTSLLATYGRMPHLVSQTLDQGGSGDGAQQLEGLA